MEFFNKYPYTDNHELNLDWVVTRIKELDLDIQGIEQRATEAAVQASKAYVDTEIAAIRAEFNILSNRVSSLNSAFISTVSDLQTQYQAFLIEVDSRISALDGRIEIIRNELNAAIIGVNARTDRRIAENNEYIFDVISTSLPTELTITNFFTGEKVSIQDMFDYLSTFHATNAATINDMVDATKSVNQIVAINETCTRWVLNGKTLIA